MRRSTRTDDSLALWRDGYLYVSSRCDAFGSDIFRTRLLLRDAYCMRGPAAAELFYGSDLFTRRGAMPPSVVHLLQDEGSVQALDGVAHHTRKRLFLPMLEPEAAESFAAELELAWDERLASTRRGDRLLLYPTMNWVLTTAALRWAGLPADARQVSARCRELVAMVENAGTVGPPNWAARAIRRRSEQWAAETVTAIRERRLPVSPDRMARQVAEHTEHGQLLDPRIAAVELLNVLRPIVAISRFVVFAALALWQHPDWRGRFSGSGSTTGPSPGHASSGHPSSGHVASGHAPARAFAHEVRRMYPFFPLIAGRALRGFEWSGHAFRPGSWLLLDLYGTNHDQRVWDRPDSFRPERFEEYQPSPYELVPQGGGTYADGHRCPGEQLTIAALARMVTVLGRQDYRVPAQDLSYPLSRMPTLPRSGFVLEL